VVGRAALIHSVDSVHLMDKIHRAAQALGIVQPCLIEVNLAREPAKGGVAPENLDALLAAAGDFSALRVEGLMAIPPVSPEKTATRQYFESLYKLFIDIPAKKYDNVTMRWLSMGMSADFELAAACGANIVRVGSAIFGPR
jgi:pyridoxal phosphate enzyme (YggS family)